MLKIIKQRFAGVSSLNMNNHAIHDIEITAQKSGSKKKNKSNVTHIRILIVISVVEWHRCAQECNAMR